MTRTRLTPERLRALRILAASGEPEPLIVRRGFDRRVVRSLVRVAAIVPADADRYTLTPTGAGLLARYRPRQRSGMRPRAA